MKVIKNTFQTFSLQDASQIGSRRGEGGGGEKGLQHQV